MSTIRLTNGGLFRRWKLDKRYEEWSKWHIPKPGWLKFHLCLTHGRPHGMIDTAREVEESDVCRTCLGIGRREGVIEDVSAICGSRGDSAQGQRGDCHTAYPTARQKKVNARCGRTFLVTPEWLAESIPDDVTARCEECFTEAPEKCPYCGAVREYAGRSYERGTVKWDRSAACYEREIEGLKASEEYRIGRTVGVLVKRLGEIVIQPWGREFTVLACFDGQKMQGIRRDTIADALEAASAIKGTG